MLHEIYPHSVSITYENVPPEKDSRVIGISGDKLIFAKVGGQLTGIPFSCVAGEHDAYFIARIDGMAWYYICVDSIADIGNCTAISASDVRSIGERVTAFAAALALEHYRWRQDTRFCPRCGCEMAHSEKERAMCCTACSKVVYPSVSPAVIVLITDGNRCFLARGKHYGAKFYSLIAGYVEAGESLEQAVCREVMEETGLRICNLRYVTSQPWPYSASIMVGFVAQLDGSDVPAINEEELEEAKWFSRDEIPIHPNEQSVAALLMDMFRRSLL